MNTPAVIVKKGGFLSSVATGFFGVLMVLVGSGAAITLYGMHIADQQLGELKGGLTEWRKVLPFGDSFNDRRALDYRDQIEVGARLMSESTEPRESVVLVEVRNRGTQVVSLLTLRVTLEDGRGVPVREFTIVAATPLALPDEWRGPLLPPRAGDAPRKIAQLVAGAGPDWKAQVEITDIRVLNPREAAAHDAASPREDE